MMSDKSEAQLLREQAADDKLIAKLDAEIAELMQRPTCKAYVQGKQELEQALALTKDSNHVKNRKSLRAQTTDDVRTANAAPELHELLAELHDEKPKTWATVETREQSHWLTGTSVVTNKRFIEERIRLIDDAIRRTRDVMRQPADEVRDVHKIISEIRASIPRISAGKMESLEAVQAAEARA
jgi:hypothetical protein